MRRALDWIEHHAVIFVLVGLIGLGGVGWELKSQGVTQSTLRVSQLRGCHRLNVERARNNRNWLHSYEADRRSLAYDQTFDSLILLSLKHPTVQPSAEQRRNTTLFLAKLRGEIEGRRASIVSVEWVPLTQCYPATDHPLTYVAPEPVPFSQTPIREAYGVLLLPHELELALYVGPGE